jgi:superfamily II DNA/RNA helicase
VTNTKTQASTTSTTTTEIEELTARAPVRPDSPTFAALGVRPETVAALEAVGIVRTFAIQEYALPVALRGSDLIGQAPTGTGKTLGFGVPILQRIVTADEGADGSAQALVVVPTRELGLQVARDIAAAGRTRGVRVLPVYGGVAYEPQIEALQRGVEVIVGTPGRLLDLARPARGRAQPPLRLDRVRTLVLDEADRMLDLGFLDDVEKILAMLPEERQNMLFSATMPDPIVTLARRFLRHPMTIHARHQSEASAPPLTRQVVYRTHPMNKVEVVTRILQAEGRGLTMIFTRTKRAADRVAGDLDFRGFAVAAVHGDLGQGARERALRAFRNGKVDVLVATDVAARGLDVSGVTHVINYDCPEDPDTYTHRIGRTGRAGATGLAVTFVDWEDMPRWRIIDKTLGLDMPEPPETYHTSPHLFSDLSIPESANGTLASANRTRAGLGAEVEEDLGGGRRPSSGSERRGSRGRGGRASGSAGRGSAREGGRGGGDAAGRGGGDDAGRGRSGEGGRGGGRDRGRRVGGRPSDAGDRRSGVVGSSADGSGVDASRVDGSDVDGSGVDGSGVDASGVARSDDAGREGRGGGRARRRTRGGRARTAENPPTSTEPVPGGAVSAGVLVDGDAAGATTAPRRRRSRGGRAVAEETGQ